MTTWNTLGPSLYRAVREMVRERGEASVDEAVLFFMRQIATNLDQSCRVEAIYDGGEMVVIEVARFDRDKDPLDPWLGCIMNRRTVVLQHEAPGELDRIEAARRLAGWFGNLPAVVEVLHG